MARIRTIKPQFFTSEDVTRCTRDARLLFVGLWTEADREGRLEDRPRQIKIRIFPGEDDLNVSLLLEELHAAELIDRYVVGNTAVIQITGFQTHQRPHPKEPASTLPAKSDKAEVVAKREPKVYFIRDASKSCIKIGVSYRPDFRLAGIQTGHSTPLTLMGSCDGGFKLEKELHQKYADYRLNGEWFEENAELLRDIETQCREKVVILPVDNPSSPVGREGKEYGVREWNGREGDGSVSPRPIVSGESNPRTWGKLHGEHLIGFCDWVCLPEFLFNEFARKSGGALYVRNWAADIRAQWEGKTIGDNLKFWRSRWSETHTEVATKPAIQKSVITRPSAAVDEALETRRRRAEMQAAGMSDDAIEAIFDREYEERRHA